MPLCRVSRPLCLVREPCESRSRKVTGIMRLSAPCCQLLFFPLVFCPCFSVDFDYCMSQKTAEDGTGSLPFFYFRLKIFKNSC